MYYKAVGQTDSPIRDEQIAKQVQEGDKEAFGFLVDRYQGKLQRYGTKFLSRKEDIEDIVQDVFMSAYKNIKSFHTDERFSPWIYRIAHNAFVNGLRKKERSPLLTIDFDTLVSHAIYEDPAESEREQKETRDMLDKVLTNINPRYREILVLHYFEEMPYRDIAEVLQIPIGTVGVRIRRAKEALKRILTKTI